MKGLKHAFIICLTLCCIFMFACKTKDDVKNNISEITTVYFVGTNGAGDYSGSISVGQRENPYIIDGKSQKLCDFSLVCAKFDGEHCDEIEVDISVNGKDEKLTLFFNPVNFYYMNDLGYALKSDDNVEIRYNGEKITFENASKNFNIDSDSAIDLALKELSEEIQNTYEKGVFRGECYLKVLLNAGGEEPFWCFSIEREDGTSITIVLSTFDGKIIVTNK